MPSTRTHYALRAKRCDDGVLYVRIIRFADNAPRSVDEVIGAGFPQRYQLFKEGLVSVIALQKVCSLHIGG